MKMNWKFCIVALTCALAVACGKDNNDNHGQDNHANHNNHGEDAGNNNSGEPDVSTPEDSGNGGEDAGDDEDVTTIGDVGDPDANNGECDTAAAMATAWPLHDAVAAGAITVTDEDGTWTAVVDASAGGAAEAANNPFIYLDLDGGAKVDISDITATTTDDTWEFGFRRTDVFINSGDAGPGALEIALLTGVEFDDITDADIPADDLFVEEDQVDDNCEVPSDPDSRINVFTVFNQLNPDTFGKSWYDYDVSTHSITAFADHVYIVRNTDQSKTYKFSFVSWNTDNPGALVVKWAEL